MSKAALHTVSAHPHGHAHGHERTKLLIIEDDKVHRMIIKKVATALGFHISEADSYDRAIAMIDHHKFDCATLDIGLQPHSGLDVLRHLWNVRYRIPVLIISGADDAKRAETMGFAEVMNIDILHVVKKPLDLRALNSALNKLKVHAEINGAAKH
jgi:CheY-like chemotaxis protein